MSQTLNTTTLLIVPLAPLAASVLSASSAPPSAAT